MTLGARPAAVSVPRRSALVVVLSASPGGGEQGEGGESSFPAGSLVPGPEQTPLNDRLVTASDQQPSGCVGGCAPDGWEGGFRAFLRGVVGRFVGITVFF